MSFRAVIFDLWGTLIPGFSLQEHERTVAVMAEALGAPAEEFGRHWTGESHHGRMIGELPTVEANVEHVCRALGMTVEPAVVIRAAAARTEFTRRYLVPRPGAIDTLARLRELGFRTGLISDCSAEVPLLWPDTLLMPLIDAPVFSCCEGIRKPHPRIYQLAAERLGVKPEACLYVGDGSSGELTGATRAGMWPVLLQVPLEDTYDADRTDVVAWRGPAVSSLPDLLRFLE